MLALNKQIPQHLKSPNSHPVSMPEDLKAEIEEYCPKTLPESEFEFCPIFLPRPQISTAFKIQTYLTSTI